MIALEHGDSGLEQLVSRQNQPLEQQYRDEMSAAGPELETKLRRLAELRDAAGFMAEIRLLPDGWMLIENHCPIMKAARSCGQYCASELDLFRSLLRSQASVDRVDHVLAGARRCAYKICQL